ncbi:MAG TPA: hypothetical protein VGA78_03775 [Gemmatimonadales bacterium]
MNAVIGSVPELGPLLGRFSSPAARGPEALPLDDLRRNLLGLLYQQGSAARRELTAGRPEGARVQLALSAWLALWTDAVKATADRLLGEIDRRIELAGAQSRFPERRLALAKPSEEDRRVVRARLAAAGIPLERVSPPEQASDWPDGLLRVAMALDASWERLERVVTDELLVWQRDVDRVRAWRRPTGPLWAITVAVLLLALLLGLSVGGYLPAPGPLRLLQQWFWSLSWP